MKYNDIDFNNKTILITGGAGFIGSNLAFYFQENYPDARVIVFDKFRFDFQLLKRESTKLFKRSDKIKRDFIFVEYVIQANIRVINLKKSGIYNVETGKARSFQDIIDILKKELNIQREDKYISNLIIKQYQFFTEVNIKDTQKYLDCLPNYSFEKGIKSDIPYIKKKFEEEIQ